MTLIYSFAAGFVFVFVVILSLADIISRKESLKALFIT